MAHIWPRDFMPPSLHFSKLAWYDEAFEILLKQNNSLVCVLGCPGTGLSTFMKYVSRELLDLFGAVIFVGPDVDTLDLVQAELGVKLGLWSFEEAERMSPSHRCSLIARKLEFMHYSIIFETLSSPLDLAAVGVVFHPGAKVVFGTTRADVRDAMRPNETVDIELLPFEEENRKKDADSRREKPKRKQDDEHDDNVAFVEEENRTEDADSRRKKPKRKQDDEHDDNVAFVEEENRTEDADSRRKKPKRKRGDNGDGNFHLPFSFFCRWKSFSKKKGAYIEKESPKLKSKKKGAGSPRKNKTECLFRFLRKCTK